MRNRFIAGVTLLSFTFGTGLPVLAIAPSGAAKGNVESSSGQVLRREGTDNWKALDGKDIAAGDTLRTGENGQAILAFGDSRLRLAPQTDLRVVSAANGKTEVVLERGKVLGRTNSKVTVKTAKTLTSASQGEFVLETSDKAAALTVLSGNARLAATDASDVYTPSLKNIPDANDKQTLRGVDTLGKVQTNGDVALFGEWRSKGKGTGPRKNSNETVGGEEDASPDQDVQPPSQPQPPQPPVTTPPVVAPPVVAPPVTTAPVTSTVAAAGGGSALLPIIGGALLIGGLAAIIASNDSDDDDENVFIPNDPGVPSPSLP